MGVQCWPAFWSPGSGSFDWSFFGIGHGSTLWSILSNLSNHHSFHSLADFSALAAFHLPEPSGHFIGHWQLRGAAGKLVTCGNCSERLPWANGTMTTTITTIVGRWIRTIINGRSPVTTIGNPPGTRVTRQLWNVWGSEFWLFYGLVERKRGQEFKGHRRKYCPLVMLHWSLSNIKQPRQSSSQTSNK